MYLEHLPKLELNFSPSENQRDQSVLKAWILLGGIEYVFRIFGRGRSSISARYLLILRCFEASTYKKKSARLLLIPISIGFFAGAVYGLYLIWNDKKEQT